MEFTPEQQAEYEQYIAFLQANPGSNFPVPTSIDDYYANRDTWIAQITTPTETTPPAPERTEEEEREYSTFRRYASAYGEPGDWYPRTEDDYFANWDVAQDQIEIWERREQDAERKRMESERRSDEAYQAALQSRWRAEEAAAESYRPEPEYDKSFFQWFEEQGTKPMPLQNWMESMYGKLIRQFEATRPTPHGYPTRDIARRAGETETAALLQWLPEQEEKITESYYLQSPRMRGETPALFAPKIRSVNF